jgi:hypothetical protein
MNRHSDPIMLERFLYPSPSICIIHPFQSLPKVDVSNVKFSATLLNGYLSHQCKQDIDGVVSQRSAFLDFLDYSST